MSHFRIRHEERGGHTHIQIFAGPNSKVTHGKCGDLCMTNVEFTEFKQKLQSSEFEFVETLGEWST